MTPPRPRARRPLHPELLGSPLSFCSSNVTEGKREFHRLLFPTGLQEGLSFKSARSEPDVCSRFERRRSEASIPANLLATIYAGNYSFALPRPCYLLAIIGKLQISISGGNQGRKWKDSADAGSECRSESRRFALARLDPERLVSDRRSGR